MDNRRKTASSSSIASVGTAPGSHTGAQQQLLLAGLVPLQEDVQGLGADAAGQHQQQQAHVLDQLQDSQVLPQQQPAQQQQGLPGAASATWSTMQYAAPVLFEPQHMEQVLGSTESSGDPALGLGQMGNNSPRALQQRVQFVGASELQVSSRQQQDLHSIQPAMQPELLHAAGIFSLPHQQQSKALGLQLPQPLLAPRKRLAARRLQQSNSSPGPQFISASMFYGPSAVPAAGEPGIAFSAMQVGFSVMGFSWQPEVSVSPAEATVQAGQSTSLQYSVKVTRSELPRRTIIRGSLLISNPTATALKLREVAVEAPSAGKPSWVYVTAACGQGGTLASLLSTPVVTVPSKGQVTCTFSASYPGAAPSNGVLFATAVTDAGKQLLSDGFAFTRPSAEVPAAQAVKIGECAVFSDTFLTSADSTALITPSQLPASGSKAPAAANVSMSGERGGVLLCNNGTYTYTVEVAPSHECGVFKVTHEDQHCMYIIT